MSEMIERIVKTLRDIDLTVGTPNYYQIASAVIETMREPTMEMESAASNWQGPQMTYSDVWRAMIDEALK